MKNRGDRKYNSCQVKLHIAYFVAVYRLFSNNKISASQMAELAPLKRVAEEELDKLKLRMPLFSWHETEDPIKMNAIFSEEDWIMDSTISDFSGVRCIVGQSLLLDSEVLDTHGEEAFLGKFRVAEKAGLDTLVCVRPVR